MAVSGVFESDYIMKSVTHPYSHQQGFTLLELLVVLTILVAVAGIGVTVVGGVEDDANDDFVQTEIRSLVTAVKRFQADMGLWPGDVSSYTRKNAFDWVELRHQSGAALWSPASSRGWRGPYITELLENNIEVTQGDAIALTGQDTGSTDDITATDQVSGLLDPWDTPYALVIFGTNDYNGAVVSAGENTSFDTLPISVAKDLCGTQVDRKDDWVLCF